LVKIGAGPDGRTRSLTLTTTGEARLKAAAVHWRRAQREFEIAVGVGNAADLRTVLQRVIAVT
ncbi:MAG: MarR family transcriptional regulator, partial [Pseudolabrys sp.]